MRKATRTALFFAFFALFVIVSPVIIAYSQGYRFDWENKNLVKTGGLFLEPRPAPVKLYINGKFEKESNFVFQNIFIGDLLPKTYLVEVKKEGYSPWRKALSIEEKLVREVKNLMLFPSSPKIEKFQTDKHIKTFSPNNSTLSLIETGAYPSITLYDKKSKRDTLVLNNFLARTVKGLLWNNDATRAILDSGTSRILISPDKEKHVVAISIVDISDEIFSNKEFSDYTVSLYAPRIDDMRWGDDSNTLYFLAKDARVLKHGVNILFSYNVQDKKLSPPLAYNILNYQISEGKLIYVSSILGDVGIIDLGRRTITPLSTDPVMENKKDTAEIIAAGGDKVAVLVNNGFKKSAYVYKKDTGDFEKILKDYDIETASISKDKNQVIFLGENFIIAYWFEEVHIQPFHEPGDIEEIYNSEIPILSATWFDKDNAHIFFSTKDGVWVTELDGRDKRNTHKLSDLPAKEMSYDASLNTLYILSNNALYSISLQ